MRIYRGGPSPAPAVVYCHSGAFVLGNLDVDHRQCVELAKRGRCTVISVDYRLAPEHPFPAGLDDAATVLDWAADSGTELDIDTSRLAVAGSSAGGALAARLVQCNADGSAPRVVFQLLHQPVLDDRPTPSKEEFDSAPGFDASAVTSMWQHYLAGGPASELDPLRDEAVDYAWRLMQAGVATELHVFPGTCHGFDAFVPDWEMTRQLFGLQGAALRRAFTHAAG